MELYAARREHLSGRHDGRRQDDRRARARAAPEAALRRLGPRDRGALWGEDPGGVRDRGRGRLPRPRSAGDRRAHLAAGHRARHRRRRSARRRQPPGARRARHRGLSARHARASLRARAPGPQPAAARRRRPSRTLARALPRARSAVSRSGRRGDRYRPAERAGAGSRPARATRGPMETLSVALGNRAYPIHIGAGLIARAELYRPYLGGGGAAIVTSSVVAPLYLRAVRNALGAAAEVIVPDGEQAKSWQGVEQVVDALLAARLGRDGLVVALGGGVIGDLAGFAAAVYQRGVPFVQVPTTLLAQVDSSVGGKTAINHARGKNMVGAFHQPLAVIADVATLDTLPDRELRAGIAEVIKHGLVLDLEFLAWLEQNVERLLARDRAALAHAVRRSCELKAEVVAADEREAGRRAILNFGHTFGHAIEAGAGYGEWLHGEAVAAGMAMAVELSVRAGTLRPKDAERAKALIARAGLPVQGPKLAVERYLELMQVDKKAAGGRVHFILLDGLGRAARRGDLDPRLVRESIAAASQ